MAVFIRHPDDGMDTLRTMSFGDLPPVGESICLKPRLPLPAFGGYRDLWLNSGTAALALAFLHAHWQRLEIKKPEVIMPAYGCPDLVAAAVYAGVKPVLVDVQEDDPAYDLNALEQALNDNTVAVVAVNFLGIAERLDLIRELLPSQVVLVEDNAQWHPEDDTDLVGEYVVSSFGRGKPASVLGGGLLLIRQDLSVDREWVKEQFSAQYEAPINASRHQLKATAYNVLRQPAAYFWLNRSGLFNLGETLYQPLQGIVNMAPACQSLVAANIQQHLSLDRWREAFYDEAIDNLPGLKPLARDRRRRLLRYPLLWDSSQQRDSVLKALIRQGLGASALYCRPLLDIPGVKEKVVVREIPTKAAVFAQRLLTLPLHSGVSPSHLERIVTSLQNHASDNYSVPRCKGGAIRAETGRPAGRP